VDFVQHYTEGTEHRRVAISNYANDSQMSLVDRLIGWQYYNWSEYKLGPAVNGGHQLFTLQFVICIAVAQKVTGERQPSAIRVLGATNFCG